MIRQSLVLLIVVATTILGWRLLDGQIDAANVEGPLHGVTYAPWAKDQDPIEAKASGVWSFLRTAFTDAQEADKNASLCIDDAANEKNTRNQLRNLRWGSEDALIDIEYGD